MVVFEGRYGEDVLLDLVEESGVVAHKQSIEGTMMKRPIHQALNV